MELVKGIYLHHVILFNNFTATLNMLNFLYKFNINVSRHQSHKKRNQLKGGQCMYVCALHTYVIVNAVNV
jgi:hypothetical protein